MPQQQQQGNTKKKKKGRAPAHQNVFAFKHNPKSKKTEKILESPILHCCRRCHDKLVWRKKYRKYKPRTQLGGCNLCLEKRVVKYAYHTICTKCTTSDAAWKAMMMSNSGRDLADGKVDEESEAAHDEDEEETEREPVVVADEPKHGGIAARLKLTPSANPQRVCAICVKEIALPDEGGPAHSIEDIIARMGPMSLRQRKGLERQLLRQQEEQDGTGKAHAPEGEPDDGEQEEEADDTNDDDTNDEEEDVQSDPDEIKDDIRKVLDDCDEDDPFLVAIGGADKLLVGEAYQKMLLSKVGAASTRDT